MHTEMKRIMSYIFELIKWSYYVNEPILVCTYVGIWVHVRPLHRHLWVRRDHRQVKIELTTVTRDFSTLSEVDSYSRLDLFFSLSIMRSGNERPLVASEGCFSFKYLGSLSCVRVSFVFRPITSFFFFFWIFGWWVWRYKYSGKVGSQMVQLTYKAASSRRCRLIWTAKEGQ